MGKSERQKRIRKSKIKAANRFRAKKTLLKPYGKEYGAKKYWTWFQYDNFWSMYKAANKKR